MSRAPHLLDLVEELRLRRWARENYAAIGERSAAWHDVIHDEMSRRDRELQVEAPCRRSGIVPLQPYNDFDATPHAIRLSTYGGHGHDIASPHYA